MNIFFNSSGELSLGGMNNPIRVYIYTMHHLGNVGCIRGSGEDVLGNLFASFFLQKDKIPLTCCRISKYDAGKKTRFGDI